MNPIENLLDDHRHIMAVLEAIDWAVMGGVAGQRDLPLFERALRFIVTFADGIHYAKEDRLFAACVSHAVPCAVGPVQCLQMEHDGTRAQTARIAAAIESIRGGDAGQWPHLLDAAARYSAIVRVHIPKENLGFFPMSDLMLPAPARAALGAEFEAIDRSAGVSMAEAAAAVRRGAAPPSPPRTTRPVSHVDFYRLEDPRLEAILRDPAPAPPQAHVVVRRGQRGRG